MDQLAWAKNKATLDRTTLQAVVEAALVAYGAPADPGVPVAPGP